MNDIKAVTCQAPVNIAVIKYWGKRDEKYNLPLNSSLSVTLDIKELCALTNVTACRDYKEDRLWLNGREEEVKDNKRIQKCLQEVRRLSKKRKIDANHSWIYDSYFHISSENNFPTAAGLASSAAGYACLVSALCALLQVEGEISGIARQGSGSACRSMYGGFIKWNKGECVYGSDSIAIQVAPETHWPELHVLVLVVTNKKKGTSSTEGMQRTAATSELLKYRIDQVVPKRIEAMERAIIEKDFDAFAEITMKESNQFHAVCLDTYPPIIYLNEISHAIIRLITTLNKESSKIKAAYTFDAGPNAFVFTTEENLKEMLMLLRAYFPPADDGDKSFIRGIPCSLDNLGVEDLTPGLSDVLFSQNIHPWHMKGALQYIIHTKPGPCPRLLDSTASLLEPITRTVKSKVD